MSETTAKKIDHLTEDDIIPNQKFVCISFVSPEGIRNCTTRGVKIRGSYPTYDEAQERCKQLQEVDPDFDIFVGEVGKWLPWDPDPNSAGDQKYQEEELQKIVDGYKQNLSKAKKMQKQRKDDMLRNAALEEKSRKDKTRDRLRKKLEEKKAKKRIEGIAKNQLENSLDDLENKKVGGKKKKTEFDNELDDRENELKSEDKVAKEERERLHQNQKMVEDQQNTVDSIDDKLAKIQDLYKKLQKK